MNNLTLRMSKVQVLVNKGYITPDWAEVLKEPLEYFYSTTAPVINEAKVPVYPEGNKVFRAFKECPYKDLKLIVLGQDPYFNPGEAVGLSFDVSLGIKKPKSLQMVLKEIESDVQPIESAVHISSSHLGHLPKQGVLLLNTALTVEHRKPLSHAELWKPFTDDVIKKINEKDNIVWLLFGKHAQSYKQFITNPTHKIVEGCHPAARGRHNTFLGGKYFSKCNKHLESMGHKAINW
jgi:uracil-DNA glycosylase